MGRSASLYPLVPTGTKPRPPTNRAVRAAITKLLDKLFYEEAPAPWGEQARRWLWGGETALVGVQRDDELKQPAERLELWVNRVPDWPIAVAEHWLQFMLAWRRDAFEAALGKLGVAIPPERWPDLLQVTRWDMDGLPDDMRAADAPAGRCACKLCERYARILHPVCEVRAGHHAEPLVAGFVVNRVVAPRSGGVIASISRPHMYAWTARVDGHDLHPIPQLTNAKREIRLLQEVGDAVVAFLITDSAKVACEWSESRDGGATWSEPAPTGLPAMTGPTPFFCEHHPELLFVAGRKSPMLYRSDDAGRSFGRGVQVLLDGQPPKAISDVMQFGERVVALLQRGAKEPPVMATSANGIDFVTLEPPLEGVASLWSTSDGAIVVFGYRDSHAMAARSRDGGATWTRTPAPSAVASANLGGRWFVVSREPEPGGLHVSDDEGQTWREVLRAQVGELTLDDADPSSCYTSIGGVLFRVVVG